MGNMQAMGEQKPQEASSSQRAFLIEDAPRSLVPEDLAGLRGTHLFCSAARRRAGSRQCRAYLDFQHAWADLGTGHVFCVSEGPSAEAARRHHARTGHPANEIRELAVTV
jgi:hypothetical protein